MASDVNFILPTYLVKETARAAGRNLAAILPVRLQAEVVVTTTIQAAIDAAQPGNTVIIPAGVYTESLTLSKPVSLTGASSAATMIHALDNQRVLTITGAAIDQSVVISGLTVMGGNANGVFPANHGGGMWIGSAARPLLQNVVITNNYAYLGGGLHVSFDTAPTLLNVSVLSNVAEYDGGGIWNAGTLTLAHSALANNRLLTLSGAEGGGVFNYVTLVVTASAVYSNSATFGGGIFSQGTLTVSHSTILGNVASSAGGGIYHEAGASVIAHTNLASNTTSFNGGGVYLFEGTLHVENSVLSDNQAGGGGALYNSVGNLTVTDTLLSGNRALGSLGSSGGGLKTFSIAQVSNSAFQDNHADGMGGGISVNGPLTVVNSTLHGNSADSGGGIYQSDPLTVSHSTLYSNTATLGGGIYHSFDPLVVENSTLSGNAARFGGGLHNNGDTANLNNVTLVGNSAVFWGGGVFYQGGEVNLKHTILAMNLGSLSYYADCYGTLTSQGYNLIQNPGNCTISGTLTGNISGASPDLGPLQDNGGPTPTHATLNGSPAVDAGDPAGCTSLSGTMLPDDQRGSIRPVDGTASGSARCDIGAYESVPVRFSADTISIGENDGAATMTVTLGAMPSYTASIAFATSNGTALAGYDYLTTTGILTFAPGVTTQTFSVIIVNDTFGELDETVTLILDSPFYADLADPSIATLTILDDDPPPNYIYLPIILRSD